MKPSTPSTISNLRKQEQMRSNYGYSNNPTDNSEITFNYQKLTADQKKQHLRRRKHKFSAATLAFIILLFFIIVAVFNFISSPIVTIARLAMDTFDTQTVTTDARMTALLEYKLSSDPSQPSKYQEVADYKIITQELASRLEREQIRLDQANHTASFRGKKIESDQLKANLHSDINLIKAVNDATAINRVMFQDQTWNSYKTEANVTQKGFSTVNNHDDITKQELNLTSPTSDSYRFSISGSEQGGNGVIQQFNMITQNLAKMNKTADELEQAKQTPTSQTFDNLILIDDPHDSCTLYQTARHTQDYQKTAQAAQLRKLSALIITEADKIRAGEADNEVVNYLNDRLTQSTSYTDQYGNQIYNRSAMESYAQNYLSGNISGAPDSSAQKYSIGANQPIALTIEELQKSGQSDDCKKKSAWQNFFTSIFNFFMGRRPSEDTTKYLTNEVKVNTTATNLSSMTGLATAPDLSGEDLANGFASGAAELFGKSAQRGGLMPLTKNQAVAYLSEQQALVAKRAEIDRLRLSPFDTSSPYTFLGSIANRFQLINQKTSIPMKISALISTSNSVFNLGKTVSASDDQIRISLNQCFDDTYRKAHPEIALGPYCNTIYGTPVEVLHENPETIINKLVASGNLEIVKDSCDERGNFCQLQTSGELKEYEESCVNRQIPLGDDNDGDLGEKCFATTEIKKLFPVYLFDKRINQNLKKQRMPGRSSNRLVGPSRPITLENLSEYQLAKSADKISQILSVIRGRALYQGGPGRGSNLILGENTPYNQACDRFAIHHARGLEGRFGDDFSGMNINSLVKYGSGNKSTPVFSTRTHPFQGSDVFNDPGKRQALIDIYNAISRGNVCVIRAGQKDNPESNRGRHFVTVIGFEKGVRSADDLRESDLLILDAADGKLHDFGRPGARYLHNGRYNGGSEWWTSCAGN